MDEDLKFYGEDTGKILHTHAYDLCDSFKGVSQE
jgi:hypothetical protein